jgi:hypothetical protein
VRKIAAQRIGVQFQKNGADSVRPIVLLLSGKQRSRLCDCTFLRLELVPQRELHDSRVREQPAEGSERTGLIDVVRDGVHIEFRMV